MVNSHTSLPAPGYAGLDPVLRHVNLRSAIKTNQQTHQAHDLHRVVAARHIRVDHIDRFLVRRVAGRTLDPDLVKQQHQQVALLAR